jgi:hypothetical protein
VLQRQATYPFFDDSASSILLTVSALIRCISKGRISGQGEPAKLVNDGAVP